MFFQQNITNIEKQEGIPIQQGKNKPLIEIKRK